MSAHSRSRIPLFCLVCEKVLSNCNLQEISHRHGRKAKLLVHKQTNKQRTNTQTNNKEVKCFIKSYLVEYDGEADRRIQLSRSKKFHLHPCKLQLFICFILNYWPSILSFSVSIPSLWHAVTNICLHKKRYIQQTNKHHLRMDLAQWADATGGLDIYRRVMV